ncbi:MAG TPA: hypothetical protein VF633_02480 [Brevundimonas sp.]|jgi:hypothetical protein
MTAPVEPRPAQDSPRQPTLRSVALTLLVGCCLCASLIASLF